MVASSRAPLRPDRLRVLNAPRPVTVELAATLPVAVGGRPESERTPIETILEIWQIDDEWWRHRIARRYVEAVLVGGARVVFFQDLTTGGWFLQQS
jgi:hypothetical protein